ncbi:MAG: hypothetical protein MJK11_02010 [Pseudomonadales bacterium]|nr:hypothetical protein [Pseudomonadales bacterium]
MKYHLMTDVQIMEDLGKQFEQLRLFKNLTVDQVCEQGGTNKLTVNRFTHNKNAIRLDGLISILRGVGELDKLEALFELPEKITFEKSDVIKKKRVRKPTQSKKLNEIKWGNDE